MPAWYGRATTARGLLRLRSALLTRVRSAARRGARPVRVGLARLAARTVREVLRCYVRAAPATGADRGAEPSVTILLGSAWGMGGTIRAVLNVAGYLARRHEVEILSLVRRRDAPFFKFPPGVKVTALDDQRPNATPRGLRVVRNAFRSRSSALMPPAWRPFPVCSLWTDVRLASALRGRSGVLIGTHPCLNLVAADLSPPGQITIGQEHMHLHAHPESVRRAIARGYPRLDALVTLTDPDAREFTVFLPAPPKIAVIPNSARKLGGKQASLSGTTILAAGRLTPQKGFDLLIPAFARVAAEHPDWRLRICGGGHERNALQRLIDEHGLADVATLTGPVRRLGKQMQGASLFVLSSRFEGFPLILLEAMSKGLPVVSFDCPTGPREVIDDHRNGILVPAGDIDALATGILEVIADDDLRHRLGAAATLTANEYRIEAIGPKWEQLFDELTSAPQ
jgi:glycosyltransferase involved in cell wall biosynthesis